MIVIEYCTTDYFDCNYILLRVESGDTDTIRRSMLDTPKLNMLAVGYLNDLGIIVPKYFLLPSMINTGHWPDTSSRF